MIKFCLSNHFDVSYRYQLNRLSQLDVLRERAVVIVPEQSTLQAEQMLLKNLNGSGLMHIEVLSFRRIVQRALENTKYNSKAALSDLGKRLLLSEIIDQVDAELEIYAGANKKKGFLDQLAELISDFRHQSIAIEDLKSVGSSADNALFVKKIDELALIYATYLQRLDDVTFDEDSLIHYAIKELAKTRAFADKVIVVSGFSSMIGSEQQLLLALAEQSPETYIHVVVDSECKVDDYARNFIDDLQQKLPASAFVVETNYIAQRQSVRDFKAIFDGGAGAGGIACFNAANKREELDAVFIDMVKRHRAGGCRWRDMAIVSNQLSNYHRLIERVAAIYQVPVFIDGRRPAISHYIVDFILSLLRAILYNYRTRDVIKLVKTGFFDLPEEIVWQIENYALSHNLHGLDWFRTWREDEADLFTSAAPVLEQLKRLQKAFKAAPAARAKIDVLRTFLDETAVLKRIAEDVERLYDAAEYQESEELAQVYNIIDGVFYQIYAIGEERVLALEQFYELLKLGFENYEIGVIPQVQDDVIVGNIKRTRLPELAVIYFVGMDDNAIPSAALRATLFNDDEMQQLQTIGLTRLPTQVYSFREEVYKTYEHILKAVEVNWYYSKMTTAGDLLRPSSWLQRLNGEQAVRVSVDELADLELDLVYAEKIMRDVAGAQIALDDYKKLPEHFNQGAANLMTSAFVDGKTAHNRAEQLDEGLVKALYGYSFDASVSRLESYAACPYQHFVRYGLKPRIEKEASLDFLDVGDFYHKVIENVMNELAALSLDRLDGALLDKIYQKHYDYYIERHYRFRYNAKNRYFAGRLKIVLATALSQLVAQLGLGAFRRFDNEVRFDNHPNADLPALKIQDDAVSVNLRGVIDRVDFATTDSGDYLRVVDYKSSQRSLDVNQVLHGLQLQLMIYLNAACHFGGAKSNVQPFGAFYFSVDEVTLKDDGGEQNDSEDLLNAFRLDGIYVNQAELIGALDYSFDESGASNIIDAKMTKKGLKASRQAISADELAALKQYALYKAGQLARQIYRGDIAIKPLNDGNSAPCDYCQYKDICRFDDSKCTEGYRRLSKCDKTADAVALMKERMGDESDN